MCRLRSISVLVMGFASLANEHWPRLDEMPPAVREMIALVDEQDIITWSGCKPVEVSN
jgi:hypothetical protein